MLVVCGGEMQAATCTQEPLAPSFCDEHLAFSTSKPDSQMQSLLGFRVLMLFPDSMENLALRAETCMTPKTDATCTKPCEASLKHPTGKAQAA